MSDDKLQNATSDALRQLGRDDLADQLGAAPDPEPEPVEDEGEQFLRELTRRAEPGQGQPAGAARCLTSGPTTRGLPNSRRTN